MASKTDKQVQDLFKIVQQKKSEISKAEKPNWLTNCSFFYDKNNSSTRFNIQTITDTDELVQALAFLIEKEKAYDEANDLLGLSSRFKWAGFGLDDWKTDFQTRINKLQIKKKKDELELLESRLNSLISPELRTQLELEAITKQLTENQ